MSLKIPCNPTQHITKEDKEIEFITLTNNNKYNKIQERSYTPDSLNDDYDNESLKLLESTTPTSISSLEEEDKGYNQENIKEMSVNDDNFNEFIDNEQFNDYNQYFEIDDHEANLFDDSEEEEDDDDDYNDYEYEEDDDDNNNNQDYLSLFKYTLKKAKPILTKKYASTGFLYNRFTYLDTIVECEENQLEQSSHSDLMNESNKRSSLSCFNLTTNIKSTNRPLTTKIIIHKGPITKIIN
jgi:TATA-binding protein-associated factor Taf7